MKKGVFGASDLTVSGLGLGCSHIASLSTKPGRREIDHLLDRAYEHGIRVFDTADIYGQGDSERRLAQFAKRPETVICTKAGLALKTSQALVRLAKPILRPLLQQMPRGKAKAAQMRQAAQSVDFDTARLSRRLEDSLRRLKRDRVEIFLLHGPTLDDLADGRLYDLLDTLKERGLAHICGVSANTVHDACHIANSGRVGALQVPLHPGADCADLLSTAERAGVGIMAREVLTGAAPSPETLPRVLSPLVQDPRISTILVGTTARAHLDMNVSAYQAALAGSA